MRVAQLWHWIYFRGADRFEAMTNVGKGLRGGARRGLHARPARGRRRAGLEGRHPQVADPHAADRPARPRRRDRVRLHPRERPRHALRLQPGRLHADLLLLPHRHAAARAQPDRAGDRGAGRSSPATGSATGRASRRPRARARRACCRPTASASSPTSSSWAWASRSTISTTSSTRSTSSPTTTASSLSRRRITVSTSGVVPQMRRLGPRRTPCWRSRCTP